MFDASNVKNAKVCVLAMEAKIQKYKWDDLNLKKLSLNVNHFTDSIFLKFYQSGISTVPAGTYCDVFMAPPRTV